jgi:hypothetical protein
MPPPEDFSAPAASLADFVEKPLPSLSGHSATTPTPSSIHDQPATPESPVDSSGPSDPEAYIDVSFKLMSVKARDLEEVCHWKGIGEAASLKSPPALSNFDKTPAIGDVFTYESTSQKKSLQAWIFRASGNATIRWHDITKILTDHTPVIPHPTAKGFCLWLRDDYTPNYIKLDTYRAYVAKLK